MIEPETPMKLGDKIALGVVVVILLLLAILMGAQGAGDFNPFIYPGG